MAARTFSRIAASRTVRAMGPAVSCERASGMMPARLTSPTVGLMPTIPLTDDGRTIELLVSVPTATAHRLAATATAEPELEPDGLRSRAYGFRVNPPRPLHPPVQYEDRISAHSLRLVFPRITAPALRSSLTR